MGSCERHQWGLQKYANQRAQSSRNWLDLVTDLKEKKKKEEEVERRGGGRGSSRETWERSTFPICQFGRERTYFIPACSAYATEESIFCRGSWDIADSVVGGSVVVVMVVMVVVVVGGDCGDADARHVHSLPNHERTEIFPGDSHKERQHPRVTSSLFPTTPRR
ncbi:hypothetical protein V1477_019138 [Vespula maculifrons]|uniref:Uncharacterized protein n=1 Tax=Vespula maculifrons TaxID=7453 RepID=A0ABD2ARN8_VESMC